MLARQWVVFGAVVLGACASSSSESNERVGDIRQNDTWSDGTRLTGVVRIYGGATVVIPAGAQIACAESTQIIVAGTLKVAGGGAHAKISCPAWSGFLVAQGGSLDIDGLDVDNPSTGFETTPGAGAVTLKNATVTNARRPFTVRANSTLNLDHVTATTPMTNADFDVSVSEIYGTLNAHYLSYAANTTTTEGIMTMRDGVVDIEDSTFTGLNGLDLVSSYGGKSVTVKYTTMAGAHCGLHFDASKDSEHVPTGSILVDHVTSDPNQFGITIYALGTAGPNVVRSSNFNGTNSWIDLQGDHGPISFTDVYTQGRTLAQNTDVPQFGTVTAQIADAKPR